jgi:hypothetical protein
MGLSSQSTLWTLILGTVMFLTVFVMCIQFVTPLYSEASKYEAYKVNREKYKGIDLNIYNQTLTFNLSQAEVHRETISGHTIEFLWWQGGYPINSYWYLEIRHVTWELWAGSMISTREYFWLQTETGKGAYGLPARSNILSPKCYDNDTDTSNFVVTCPHLELNVFMSSNTSGYDLPYCLLNGKTVKITLNYELNVEGMSTNIWSILGEILSFQTIKTGNEYTDYFLNALVSVPIYVAIGTIFYRLITGIIPFLSGGGGA